MSDKIKITFNPLEQDKLLTKEEALKNLHDFYEDLITAGFKPLEAMTLVAKLLKGSQQ